MGYTLSPRDSRPLRSVVVVGEGDMGERVGWRVSRLRDGLGGFS